MPERSRPVNATAMLQCVGGQRAGIGWRNRRDRKSRTCAWWQRWLSGEPCHQVSPLFAFFRRHQLPALRVFQELQPFLDWEAGKLPKGADALESLWRGQAAERVQ